jgi:hypothetical protein
MADASGCMVVLAGGFWVAYPQLEQRNTTVIWRNNRFAFKVFTPFYCGFFNGRYDNPVFLEWSDDCSIDHRNALTIRTILANIQPENVNDNGNANNIIPQNS